MKRYYVMVRIKSGDPECCYDSFTTEYDDIPYKTKRSAECECIKATLSSSRILNAWVEEREVVNDRSQSRG